MAEELLDVTGLVTRLRVEGGDEITPVNGISFSMKRGESLALVGESGSGKSMTVLSLMGLLPSSGRVTGGRALFDGRDLLAMKSDELRRVRGRSVGMVFQDPATSLNPVLTIGQQMTEGLRAHFPAMAEAERAAKAIELLSLVGIPDARARLQNYPHEFSGGQRQRILTAMAISCEPALLIADEPTTALDVTIQAQIVELLKDLQQRLGMAILWITHDLALVAGLVDRIVVMYGGTIVEEAPVRGLFKRPRHPYTRGLLNAIPQTGARHDAGARLTSIPGSPPELKRMPTGCAFAIRCSLAIERCRVERPPLRPIEPNHQSACFRAEEL